MTAIATGEVLVGSLPPRPVRLAREWLAQHRDELMADFERAGALEPLAPLP